MDTIIDELEQTPWQCAATLTLNNKALRTLSHELLADPSRIAYREFVRKVATATGLRIGAVSVVVWDTPHIRNHIHLLMTGHASNSSKALTDYPARLLEDCWAHGLARVTPVTDNNRAVRYLAKNQNEGGTGYNFHGQRLLNRLTSELSAAA